MTKGTNLGSLCSKSASVLEKQKSTKNEAAEFEEAIEETEYGKFNILLLLVSIIISLVVTFDTTSLSYVFTAAQCDLNLSLDHKGILNAVTYVGMVTSCFFWGFISDTFGRRMIIVSGNTISGVITVLSAFAQSYEELIVYKFLGGLITIGPYGALVTYLSELHGKKYRSRVLMFSGSLFGFGTILMPLLAAAILPLNISYSLFGGGVIFRSWNLFLLITAIPGFVSGITFIFMPETPKFLMTNGENEKALEVLRTVYRMNTGRPKESYPVTKLIDERQQNGDNTKRTFFQRIKEGWGQLAPLGRSPNAKNLTVVCLMMMGMVTCMNSLRLWLPMMFSAIDGYQGLHNGTTGSLCDMLEYMKTSEGTEIEPESCIVNVENFFIYFNSMVVGGVAVLSYILVGFIINSVSKKILLPILTIISGASVMLVYYANDVATILALTSINFAFAVVSIDITITIITVLFPTSLRSMAILIPVLFGRASSIVGNIVFPYLLKTGCGPPFIFLGSGIIACAVLSFLLPSTSKYNMK